MTYRLPLDVRRRYARNKRDRYWRDPEYRLAQINQARAQRGKPPIASLAEMGDPKAGRPGAVRDSSGRFVGQWEEMAPFHVGLPDSRASYESRLFQSETA